MSQKPFISIIVPVRNDGAHLGRCLDALLVAAAVDDCELIVVDDASTDGSAVAAQTRGVQLLSLAPRAGPAAARNCGARVARGQVLLFVDADVEVCPGTISRVAERFRAEPELAALFGSYDDSPAATNLCSQYKNLFHHFTHQHGRAQAETFWTGCGAVRRETFKLVGGFDDSFRWIEDIELGYRLRRAGHSIMLDRELQVKHLKRWTLLGMWRADIFGRALPWSRLMLERGRLSDDLNLRKSERVAAIAAMLALVLLPLSLFLHAMTAPALLMLCTVLWLNRRLCALFLRRGGPLFAVVACALHLLYYGYSSAAFAWCCAAHAWRRDREPMLSGNGEESEAAG